ncbi:MAG: acyl carrier protein [Phycisphaera sp.]|nr:MAG: acyl carrier protein [Phycisphaera sp.]
MKRELAGTHNRANRSAEPRRAQGLLQRPIWLESRLARRTAGQARPTRSCNGDSRVTEQDIEAKVIDIVAEQLGADKAKISRDTSFVDDLNADSLDTVELVMEFEDAFETSIPDDQAENIKTVGQAIEFIKGAQGTD